MPKNPWDVPPKPKAETPMTISAAWPPKDDSGKTAWEDNDEKRAERLRMSKEAGETIAAKYRKILKSALIVSETGSVYVAGAASPADLATDAEKLRITEAELDQQNAWKNDEIRGESEGGEIPAWVNFNTAELTANVINNKLAGEVMKECDRLAGRI